MQELILKLLEQLNSSVVTLIIVLLVMFWLLYRAGKLSESFEGFKTKNAKIDTTLDELNKSMAKVQATTDLLYQSHLQTVQHQSPLKLTPVGVDVAAAIDAEISINNHWDAIKEEFSRKGNPTNPYDIQIIALDIAQNCFDKIFTEEERNKIKLYAYGRGMNLLEVYPVIGIKIRDKILSEKGITVDEIDKHDPTKKLKIKN